MRNKHIKSVFFSGLIVLYFFTLSSCVSSKKIVYFQADRNEKIYEDKETKIRSFDPIVVPQPEATIIASDDILAVTVSSLSEESNIVFNFPNINPLTMSAFPGYTNGASGRGQPLGYLVDSLGYIAMPLLGNVFVKGLTLKEASDLLKRQLLKYLKEPAVSVRYLNHKITVIGEVARPQVINLLDDHTSLPDALGMTGDLTVFGMRDKIMIIRTEGLEKKIVYVDITKRDFFTSPYYYLRNNDVIYIEPRSGKVTFTDRTVQLIPIIATSITTLALVANLIFRK